MRQPLRSKQLRIRASERHQLNGDIMEPPGLRPGGSINIRRYEVIPMYLTSKYSSMPSCEPSRPRPELFTPPKGAAGLEITPVFSATMPDSRRSAASIALLMSRVNA